MRRHSEVGVGFTDLLFNALLGFVVMFVLAFILINPIARTGAVDPKAEFLITLAWPEGRAEDVDLYVRDPAGNLVWFRQREAGLMHLDRDDLGQHNDYVEVAGRKIVNPLNQEIVSVRGLVPGEFVVNVHLYREHGGEPVPATVKVEKLNPKVELVFYGTVTLDSARRRADRGALRARRRRPGTRRQSPRAAPRAAQADRGGDGAELVTAAVIGLIASYVVLALLLLSLNLRSAWHWTIKAAAIVLTSGFFVVAFLALRTCSDGRPRRRPRRASSSMPPWSSNPIASARTASSTCGCRPRPTTARSRAAAGACPALLARAARADRARPRAARQGAPIEGTARPGDRPGLDCPGPAVRGPAPVLPPKAG